MGERGWTLFLFLLHSTRGGPIVHVNEGRIEGSRQTISLLDGRKAHIDEFLGVPFAEPPIGPRRFMPPVPKSPWGSKNPFYVAQLAKTCYQEPDNFENFYGSQMWNAPREHVKEDCLYLNIWKPSVHQHKKPTPLPIMVWIFGGGFFSGSPSLHFYNGSVLAGFGHVIVVNINYRVSAFGNLYLDHPEAPGNVGFLDQQLALKWVYENALSLGGDPKQITLFGESAGSASVTAHLIAPGSKKYVSRVIMQSGSMLAPWACKPKHVLKQKGLRLATQLKCANFSLSGTQNPSRRELSAVIKCLREVETSRLSKKATGFMKGFMNFGFVPVCEDRNFFRGDVRDLVSEGKFKKVPAIAGVVANEGSFWLFYYLSKFYKRNDKQNSIMSQEDFFESVGTAFGNDFKNSSLAISAISHHYNEIFWKQNKGETCPDRKGAGIFYRDLISQAVGDYHFVCSCLEFGTLLNPVGNDLYLYNFKAVSSQNPWPRWGGAMHGYEIEFVFGVPLRNSSYSDAERTLSWQMLSAWTSFAKYGYVSVATTGTGVGGTTTGTAPVVSVTGTGVSRLPANDSSWPEAGEKKVFKVFDIPNGSESEIVFPEDVKGYECKLWKELREFQKKMQSRPKTNSATYRGPNLAPFMMIIICTFNIIRHV